MFFNQSRARVFMRECGLDALIATSHVSITYFTGYFCWLDPTIRAFMLQPGLDGRLALTGYAVFPLEGEPALVLNPLFAVNGADLWVRDIQIFGKSGVDETLTVRGKSPAGRVASAVGPDARRADRGDAVSSSRRQNTADGPTPPQPEGRQGFAAAGRRCSSSPMRKHRLLLVPCQ